MTFFEDQEYDEKVDTSIEYRVITVLITIALITAVGSLSKHFNSDCDPELSNEDSSECVSDRNAPDE